MSSKKWSKDCREWQVAQDQLRRAFQAAGEHVSGLRGADKNAGFGQGSNWGEEVLENFLPTWFESWFKGRNWSKMSICSGIENWYVSCKSFGITEDDWAEMMLDFIPAHLEYYKRELKDCEKQAVPIALRS